MNSFVCFVECSCLLQVDGCREMRRSSSNLDRIAPCVLFHSVCCTTEDHAPACSEGNLQTSLAADVQHTQRMSGTYSSCSFWFCPFSLCDERTGWSWSELPLGNTAYYYSKPTTHVAAIGMPPVLYFYS